MCLPKFSFITENKRCISGIITNVQKRMLLSCVCVHSFMSCPHVVVSIFYVLYHVSLWCFGVWVNVDRMCLAYESFLKKEHEKCMWIIKYYDRVHTSRRTTDSCSQFLFKDCRFERRFRVCQKHILSIFHLRYLLGWDFVFAKEERKVGNADDVTVC